MPLPILGILGALGGLFKTGAGLVGKWQERKMVKAQGKIDIEKAVVDGKIKRIQSQIDGDIEYDLKIADQMSKSWKDEFFTLLLSIPFIMCFIPGLQEYVAQGFTYLKENTPEWYQWAFLGAIVASFGLKDWFKKLVNK